MILSKHSKIKDKRPAWLAEGWTVAQDVDGRSSIVPKVPFSSSTLVDPVTASETSVIEIQGIK